jgi:beta-glucosidase
VGIALGATWNPALIEQAGVALGIEAKLKGARVLLAPTVNLQRTVYNGRNFECYSEDPWLSSELAVAYVRGLQSTGRGGDDQALRRQRERTSTHEHEFGDLRARLA